MKYLGKKTLLDDFEPYKTLIHHSFSNDIICLCNDSDVMTYLIVRVSEQLNLIFECSDTDIVSKEQIESWGRMIYDVANELIEKNRYSEKEREWVHSLCESDSYPNSVFVDTNSVIIRKGGCELKQDQINNTWAVFADNVLLHIFHSKDNAEQVFEYVYRDIRRSSDKWGCVIDGIINDDNVRNKDEQP